MSDEMGIEKIDLDKVDWRGSRDFFESLGEALDKLDDKDESYDFTWVGKRKAIIEAGAPINKTLRPDVKNSKNWDTTENLFIEGDNLDALKLLQESYLGKVKLIYIDPPYNTGNDFVYNDDFAESVDEYLLLSNQTDSSGNRLAANTESNGRFHSDWLTMMYARLKVARSLLAEDGIVFISIDDAEQASLKAICLEIFGQQNFVGQVVWMRKRGLDNSARFLSRNHEYLTVFARNAEVATFGRLPMNEETKKAYRNPEGDPRGPYRLLGAWARGSQGGSNFAFVSKDGSEFSERLWLMNKASMTALDADDRLVFVGDKVYRKLYISETKGAVAPTIWLDASNAANAADEIKAIFGAQVFDTVKPIPLLDRVLRLATPAGTGLVLDFFAGSGTTAEAVMRANVADGGKRHFVCIQIDEPSAPGSVASREGYETISAITAERIRRCSLQLSAENPDSSADLGYRAFKIDTSNSHDVLRRPDELGQDELDLLEASVKADRTSEDLLFQVLLDWGLELSLPIEQIKARGQEAFIVDGGALIACFESSVTAETVRAIADLKPLRAVFRDSAFDSDKDRINAEQIFAEVSPGTDVKVI